MKEILPTLISWAAMLSGYPAPDFPIVIEYMPHRFFVTVVCGGKECDVQAAYLDDVAPYTIWVDQKFSDERGAYVYGLIVHEATHALQYHSGEFDPDDCDDSLRRERMAYYVQNEFLVQNGHMPVIRWNHGVCHK